MQVISGGSRLHVVVCWLQEDAHIKVCLLQQPGFTLIIMFMGIFRIFYCYHGTIFNWLISVSQFPVHNITLVPTFLNLAFDILKA